MTKWHVDETMFDNDNGEEFDGLDDETDEFNLSERSLAILKRSAQKGDRDSQSLLAAYYIHRIGSNIEEHINFIKEQFDIIETNSLAGHKESKKLLRALDHIREEVDFYDVDEDEFEEEEQEPPAVSCNSAEAVTKLAELIGKFSQNFPVAVEALPKLFLDDLLHFCLYICATDGRVSHAEARLLGQIFNIKKSPEQWEKEIEDAGIFSVEFETTIPLSFHCLTVHETQHPPNDKSMSLYDALVIIYRRTAKHFLACGEAGEEEEKVVNAYLSNITTLKSGSNSLSNGSESKSRLVKKGSASGEVSDAVTHNLDSLVGELNSLVGLESVKKDVSSLIKLVQFRILREDMGLAVPEMSLHLVFTGNPGTGITTVARLLAGIYRELGLLKKGHLIEVDRSGLVGGYVGQTALKVMEVVTRALDGVLFIDEAYSLVKGAGNDYGMEAVNTLLKAMEDNRGRLIVIVAGYPQLMEEFLASNPGLRSRFNTQLYFEDYQPKELLAIFTLLCDKYHLQVEPLALEHVKNYFENAYLIRDSTFANGREVRNYFEKAFRNQGERVIRLGARDHDTVTKLTLNDVQLGPL